MQQLVALERTSCE